jgi:hypothetical protein
MFHFHLENFQQRGALSGIGEQWREGHFSRACCWLSKSVKNTENLSPHYKILTFSSVVNVRNYQADQQTPSFYRTAGHKFILK